MSRSVSVAGSNSRSAGEPIGNGIRCGYQGACEQRPVGEATCLWNGRRTSARSAVVAQQQLTWSSTTFEGSAIPPGGGLTETDWQGDSATLNDEHVAHRNRLPPPGQHCESTAIEIVSLDDGPEPKPFTMGCTIRGPAWVPANSQSDASALRAHDHGGAITSTRDNSRNGSRLRGPGLPPASTSAEFSSL
jgi:hypothetical protein